MKKEIKKKTLVLFNHISICVYVSVYINVRTVEVDGEHFEEVLKLPNNRRKLNTGRTWDDIKNEKTSKDKNKFCRVVRVK